MTALPAIRAALQTALLHERDAKTRAEIGRALAAIRRAEALPTQRRDAGDLSTRRRGE